MIYLPALQGGALEADYLRKLRVNLRYGLPRAIATTGVLGAATASVTFTAINPSWKHLMLLASARVDAAVPALGIYYYWNGDNFGQAITTNVGFAGIDRQYQLAAAAVVTSQAAAGNNEAHIGSIAAGSAPAGHCGVLSLLIPGYSDDGDIEPTLTLGGGGQAVESVPKKTTISMAGGFWGTVGNDGQTLNETSSPRHGLKLDSITFVSSSGNFVAGSRFDLYGLPFSNP